MSKQTFSKEKITMKKFPFSQILSLHERLLTIKMCYKFNRKRLIFQDFKKNLLLFCDNVTHSCSEKMSLFDNNKLYERREIYFEQ